MDRNKWQRIETYKFIEYGSFWSYFGIIRFGWFKPDIRLAAVAVFNLLWAILSAVLATRRGRNPWNWFFLTCFYGIFGLLFLACSKTINQGEYRESDTLAKVLWWVFLIPTTIIVTLSIIISIEKRKDDELTRKVLEDMKQEEQMYHRDRNENIPTFDDWDR